MKAFMTIIIYWCLGLPILYILLMLNFMLIGEVSDDIKFFMEIWYWVAAGCTIFLCLYIAPKIVKMK